MDSPFDFAQGRLMRLSLHEPFPHPDFSASFCNKRVCRYVS